MLGPGLAPREAAQGNRRAVVVCKCARKAPGGALPGAPVPQEKLMQEIRVGGRGARPRVGVPQHVATSPHPGLSFGKRGVAALAGSVAADSERVPQGGSS